MTLAVNHNTFKLASTTGLIFSGAPNGSTKFTVIGTLASLNALDHTPSSGDGVSDTLTISVKDSRDELPGLCRFP
jgi:hypothetical protein